MVINNKILLFINCCTKTGLLKKYSSRLLSPIPYALACDRGAHTQKITKNMQYISNDNVDLIKDPKTMKLNRSRVKPVCIMMNWLLGTKKHVMKYVNLYLDEGFDVVCVSCEPWQLLWPRRGTQVIGRDIINFMAANEGSYVVHGFSVGGYVWSEALVHALKDKELYQPALDRVEAQVWDSVVDIAGVSTGLFLAVFPNNKLAQHVTQLFMNFYLRVFYELSTRHYTRASEVYHASPCRAPALFLLSSVDPVAAEYNVQRACRMWRDMGIKCTLKCWPNSAHVMHYVSYPDEYIALLRAHLQNVSALRACAPQFVPFEREQIKTRL